MPIMWIFIFDHKNNNNVVCRLNNLVRAYERESDLDILNKLIYMLLRLVD